MQSSAQAARLDDKKIAHVRAMRREAIRRRRILVLSLALVAVVVVVLAIALHFSPLFALIPVALDAVVLVLGARAAKQARQWEHTVSRAKKVARNKSRQQAGVQKTPAMRRQAERDAAGKTAAADEQIPVDSSTNAMSESEIRETIERAKAEKQAALAAREQQRQAVEAANRKAREDALARKRDQATAKRSEHAEETQPASFTPRKKKTKAAAPAKSTETVAQAAAKRSPSKAAGKETAKAVTTTAPASKSLTVMAKPTKASVQTAPAPKVEEHKPAEPEDYTAELKKVSPSHALDAFELAANQDLISFSLGAPRHGKDVPVVEPQSLEIKSTKQVAHAEPVKQTAAAGEGAAATGNESGKPAKSAKDEQRVKHDDAVRKLVDSKKIEQSAAQRNERKAAAATAESVSAPAATSDSLGVDVDAVLARRRG